MFENLTDRLQSVLQKVRGEDKLTSQNVDDALVEVRKALIEADVSLKVTKLFLDRVRKAAIGEKVVKGITPAQKFIQVVHQELIKLLGSTKEPLKLNSKPSIIMLLGLQGSGKTTTAAKLALKLKKENKKVLLVALDLQRPAAIEQLSILAEQIEVPIYKNTDTKDVLLVAEEALLKAKQEGSEVLIFDTAGRLQVDNELMAELLLLERKHKPQEKLLVIDSLIGQEAVNVADAFNTQIGITGSILTKLDGDSRGGAALSLVEGTGTKVKFVGLGEKIEPLEDFDPESIANRILGFADIISLVKSVEENIDKQEAAALEAKLKNGNLTFESFLQMQKMISKLGNLSQLFGMLGLNAMMPMDRQQRDEMLEQGQQKLKIYEFAIQSMTVAERRNPDSLTSSRMKRIAHGSGLKETQVNSLVQEFNQMRSVVKMMSPMMKAGPSMNPNDLAGMLGRSAKAQKQEKKKGKGGPFGGGAFLKF
jgi:signal recognition particle subunit SRP54